MVDDGQNPTTDGLVTMAGRMCQQGRLTEAAEAYEHAIAAAPEALAPRVALGRLLLKLGRPRAAMAAFEEAVNRDPYLHAVCRDTRNIADAEACSQAVLENCGHILARYPQFAQAHFRKACALMNLGRFDEARRASEHALVLNPTVPAYYHVLIHTGTPKKNANAVTALKQLALCEDQLDDQDRSTLHFLLAKAAEDRGLIAEAFEHLQKGNTAKRRQVDYDEACELGRMETIARTFTPERMAGRTANGSPGDAAVFVIGMPRSGTTLVEQILASHPDVFGAGELTALQELIATGTESGSGAIPGPDAIVRLGCDYLSHATALAPDAKRIVDKQPYNFQHTGLIRLALPGAHIIHIRRDPLDTCFSCYALTFAGEIGFAYDMEELGRYYRAYAALMEHWRRVLPAGSMLEVDYEALVSDLPGEARRMIEFCGLEWDARCLDFHKSRHTVVTASVHQVRQPLYKTSVGRAQRFAAHLEPLRVALGIS